MSFVFLHALYTVTERWEHVLCISTCCVYIDWLGYASNLVVLSFGKKGGYIIFVLVFNLGIYVHKKQGRRGCDRMVVGFTTTYAIIAYHHWSCEFKSRSSDVCSIQHYMIKFVSDLRQVDGVLRTPRFPPPIKLTTTI